jgi:hypothetical protein
MRCSRTHQWFVLLTFVSTSAAFCGCGGSNTAPKTPETGAVQQFLDENPGYQEASDVEVATEEEEFAAADSGE